VTLRDRLQTDGFAVIFSRVRLDGALLFRRRTVRPQSATAATGVFGCSARVSGRRCASVLSRAAYSPQN
jgi:hypothetical protein